MKRLMMKTGWCVLFFLAVFNCVLAMRYLLPRVPFPAQLPNFKLHRIALTGHAAFAGIALLVGPFQFLDTLRRRRPMLHRRLGWLYIGTVALGAAFALPLTLHASFGPISRAGFLTLDIVWLLTTAIALRWAIKLRFDLHRRWMLRSYALAAAAISLRIMLPLSAVMGLPIALSYRTIAWLCWLTNLSIVEIWLRLRSGSVARASLGPASSRAGAQRDNLV
jgi:uncharacterized membrane protein